MPVTTLSTGLTAPLVELERRLLAAQPQIEHWFRRQFAEHVPPFYGSVDLRNSGFKLAPVDMNLFPGGFNNLGRDALPLAVQAATMAIERSCCTARNLLLIPENHTRNTFYLKNVAALARILVQAGFHVRIGTLLADIQEPTTFALPDDDSLTLEPIERHGNRLRLADGFDPCLVLLNNDLSAGVPPLLQGLEQDLLPPLHAGWTTRRKTQHFAAYDSVADEFGALLSFDPWFINPLFASCNGLDFHERQGEQQLADTVSESVRLDMVRQGERRLQSHSRDPDLLLMLGRLARAQQLWGKAQSYFEASLSIAPTLTAHAELAQLLQSLDRPDEARQHVEASVALALAAAAT